MIQHSSWLLRHRCSALPVFTLWFCSHCYIGLCSLSSPRCGDFRAKGSSCLEHLCHRLLSFTQLFLRLIPVIDVLWKFSSTDRFSLDLKEGWNREHAAFPSSLFWLVIFLTLNHTGPSLSDERTLFYMGSSLHTNISPVVKLPLHLLLVCLSLKDLSFLEFYSAALVWCLSDISRYINYAFFLHS